MSHDITQNSLVSAEEKINLYADHNITMQDTVLHAKNQDVLHTTAGIAVKGKDGVLLMEAGKDIRLTGATLEALGDNGSLILKAGNNIHLDTDTLEAKKDMTENSDNYIRTYRKTETANTLAAGKTITLAAGENLSARNTTVLSENGQITVAAKGDVNLENGYNESRDDYGLKYKERGLLSSKTTTIKSHDESKTVTASTLSGDAVQITAGGNTNMTGSQVIGTHDVAISSGKDTSISSAQEYERHDYAKQVKKRGQDTDLIGSTVSGNKVKADVDGNLNIESLQTKKEYSEENISAGMSFSTAAGKTSYGGSASKGNMKSHYESVINQAGIRAGGEGFDISVKENTDLKGGVIDSAASKDKNTLTTGTLRWEDKENKADYKAGGMGVSYSPNDKSSKLNQRGLTPNLTPTVKDKANSTTKSAVAEGTIHITNQEQQKQDIANLNRNTKNSLNQLQEIFDKTKVEERQELVGMLEKYGNQAIHRYAESKGWKDGSTEKMLLHGAFGALMGNMAGGSATTGALSGSVNEYVMGYLTKLKGEDWVQKHPDTVQWIGAGVGAAIGNLSKDVLTSTMVSLNAAKWNYLGFDLTTEPLLKRTLKKDDGQTLTDQEWHQLSNALMDIADQADPFGSDSDSLEVGNEFAKETVRQYLIEHGFTTDSTEKFMDSYEFWASDLQERQNHDNFYDLPLVRATADSIKDASDSKYIKYAINGADYVIDGLHIIESDYPGDAAYAWVVGAETAYIVGNTLFLGGRGLGLSPRAAMIGGGLFGGLAGNKFQESVENKLKEQRQDEKVQPENTVTQEKAKE